MANSDFVPIPLMAWIMMAYLISKRRTDSHLFATSATSSLSCRVSRLFYISTFLELFSFVYTSFLYDFIFFSRFKNFFSVIFFQNVV